jgi:hypothetical protein
VSLDADKSLASYRSHGSGSGSAGSTLGYNTPDTEINILLTTEAKRFYADVTLQGRNKTAGGEAKKQRLELTDLKPVSIAVGTEKEGRSYQLNLVPTVKTVQLAPKPFDTMAKDLYRLKFHSSRIMLNDSRYIGRMMATDAEMFTIEICGVASLEFSLHHLKDAEPWGRLQDGQITFSNPDGTTIEIGNVTNGGDDLLAGGGPYTVWVRWKKPQQTVEEYRAALAGYREQVKNGAEKMGAVDNVADALKLIDQELAREPGPWVTNCSACGPSKSEIVKDGE